MIILQILRRGYHGLSGWVLNAIRHVLIRRRQREVCHRRGGGAVTLQAEPGGTWPQAKACQLPQGAARKRGLAHSLISASGLQNCERMHSVVLDHQLCGNLGQRPQNTNACNKCSRSCAGSSQIRDTALSSKLSGFPPKQASSTRVRQCENSIVKWHLTRIFRLA